nr:MAG TPA: stabilization protein [Caudoviricetes sp.]
MAKPDIKLNQPQRGLNRDQYNLGEADYSTLLNGLFDGIDGGSFTLTNEMSNLLSSRFKAGFKVINGTNDIYSNATYFFLVNPVTGVGEFGQIKNVQQVQNIEDVQNNCEGCIKYLDLAEPLEDIVQTELNVYETLLADECHILAGEPEKGFQFSINAPIKKTVIKNEKCGKTIYFTDDNTPPRYIVLDNLQQYKQTGDINCGVDEIVPTCLDADKLLIFKKYNLPELIPVSIELGGRLKLGTYEFLIAYTDQLGNEISEYTSITNPIQIFDRNNVTLIQSELGTPTNYSIKLKVDNLDKRFTHYKIAVIQTTLEDKGVTRFFIEGIHNINDTTVIYDGEQNKKSIELSDLIRENLYIQRWEFLTESNNSLIGAGITTEKEINLQPVVNLLGSFLKWQTHIAKEDLYKDGVKDSLYLSINRDEVVPYSIRFLLEGGYKTSLFPLINRNAKDSDLVEVPSTNKDRISIESNKGVCNSTDRTKYWQYYNTATEDEDFCTSDSLEIVEVQEEIEKNCVYQNVITTPGATFSIETTQEYVDLTTFITDTIANGDCLSYINCPSPSDTNVYPFCNYFDIDCYNGLNCVPNYNNCEAPVLEEEELIVGAIVGEVATMVDAVFPTEYTKTKPPQTCTIYELDTTTGEPKRNTEFETAFMQCNSFPHIPQVAVFRTLQFENLECTYADAIAEVTPTSTFNQGYFHDYYGALTIAELQTSKTTIASGSEWTNKLHKGVLWFKGDILNRDNFVLEVSKIKELEQVDNIADGTLIRVSIYNKCNSTDPMYSKIVDAATGEMLFFQKPANSLDWTIINEAGTPTNIGQISGQNFYVAIDAKIISQVNCADATVYRTAPLNGCFAVVLRGKEFSRIDVTYDSIRIDKKQTYVATCTFNKPVANSCVVTPYKKGDFAYWESQEIYPDNTSLYDSSTLKVKPADINIFQREKFELEFVDGTTISDIFTPILDSEGNYQWKKDNTEKPLVNFTCRNIRHFKFPDNKVSPFMYENPQLTQSDSVIYPLGITIDETTINSFLDIAVNNGLLSEEKRNQIAGYEIFRGDITQDRSIISSGLLFDMRKYTDENDKTQSIYYSSYPYNDLGSDILNYSDKSRTTYIPHPYNGLKNDKFTYHSPETDYYRYTLPTELSIQGYIFGQTDNSYFNEVKDHPKFVILTRKAKDLAGLLAGLEVATEVAVQLANAGENYRFDAGFVVSLNPAGIVLSIIAAALSAVSSVIVNYGRYRLDWIKAFRDLGQPENFSSYFHSSAKYNYMQLLQENGNQLRSLHSAKYLKEGNFSQVDDVREKISINNVDREKSVLLTLGLSNTLTYPTEYLSFDNNKIDTNTASLTIASQNNACTTGMSKVIKKNVASPYVALKNYLPAQYGTVNSIKWLSTGYRGDLKNPRTTCLSIFGGDTYISRHTLKRKMPLFTDTAFGLASLTPFNYKFYSNIGREPRFYVDYEVITDYRRQSALFPDIDYDLKFDCETKQTNYYRPPSKFYLYYYGVPNFLTETRINTWNRTAEPTLERNFYPNTGDTSEWTQEKNVPIKKAEFFFYNQIYSKSVTTTAYRTLSDNFDQSESDCRNDKPNGIMWSQPDNSENNYNDPYLNYKPLDFYEFDSKYGKLKDIRTIEREQILIRQENATSLFNAIDVAVDDGKRADSRNLASAFARRPMTYSETDLGFGGTQSSQSVSCEFGHYSVDAKRGQVIEIPSGGQGMNEISSIIGGKPSGMRNWFKEHLPFKILKSQIANISDLDTDNAINGVGIAMGYDSRFRRVFITKKDYIPKVDPCLKFDKNIGFYTDCGESEITCPAGYTYNPTTELCEKTTLSPTLCPDGYIYDEDAQTCTLITTVPADCDCEAIVIATPPSQSTDSGQTTNISLTGNPGTLFTWTVVQNGVTGATSGSGTTITDLLINNGVTSGTAVYTITPTIDGCTSTTATVTVTVEPPAINFDVVSTNWGTLSTVSAWESFFLTQAGATTATITNFSLASGRVRFRVNTNLNSLILNNRNITTVNIVDISSMTTLNLSSNLIVTFNPIVALPNSLTNLSLATNDIVTFNPTLPLPSSLLTLNLTINDIVTFNPSIALPSSLQQLNLQANKIVTFNPTIALPNSLQVLNLATNDIVTFNPTLPLPNSLIQLLLQVNEIITFNPTIALPNSLQQLILNANDIVSFNPTLPLPTNLQQLVLNNNKITITSWNSDTAWISLAPNGATLVSTANIPANGIVGTNTETLLLAKSWTVVP